MPLGMLKQADREKWSAYLSINVIWIAEREYEIVLNWKIING